MTPGCVELPRLPEEVNPSPGTFNSEDEHINNGDGDIAIDRAVQFIATDEVQNDADRSRILPILDTSNSEVEHINDGDGDIAADPADQFTATDVARDPMGRVYSCEDLLAAIAAIEALMCPEEGCNWSAEALVAMRATLELYRALLASVPQAVRS